MPDLYICLECGNTFDEPGTYSESRPIGRESFACCPSCNSSSFENLRDNVKSRLEALLDENFDGQELDIVFDLFQGGYVNI